MITIIRAYKRAIAFCLALLVVAYSGFRLIHPDAFGRSYDLFNVLLAVILYASQLFWIWRVSDLGARFLPGRPRHARGLECRGVYAPNCNQGDLQLNQEGGCGTVLRG